MSRLDRNYLSSAKVEKLYCICGRRRSAHEDRCVICVRVGRACMRPGCDWAIGDREVLCHAHVSKIPVDLAIELERLWCENMRMNGPGRSRAFDKAWSKAWVILEVKS